MANKFITFHTMIRGSGKPQYVLGCARALAEKGAKVLVFDGLLYEQSAIPHQFFEMFGSSLARPTNGKNLYDLISDYETLCAGKKTPPKRLAGKIEKRLIFPVTRMHQNHLFPDVLGRTVTAPGNERIHYMAGNDSNVVEVKKRLDFHALFDFHSGLEFFRFIREQLSEEYDFILLVAPAGHQEISGIFCGHMADVILAIDVDSPAVEADPSFQACRKLSQRIQEEGYRPVSVKSVKGHGFEEVVEMIREGAIER